MSRRDKGYEVRSVRVERFKSGPRAGETKPVKLPPGALPCGVVSGFGVTLYYLAPRG